MSENEWVLFMKESQANLIDITHFTNKLEMTANSAAVEVHEYTAFIS